MGNRFQLFPNPVPKPISLEDIKNYNIWVGGDRGVGKTSFLIHFIYKEFTNPNPKYRIDPSKEDSHLKQMKNDDRVVYIDINPFDVLSNLTKRPYVRYNIS